MHVATKLYLLIRHLQLEDDSEEEDALAQLLQSVKERARELAEDRAFLEACVLDDCEQYVEIRYPKLHAVMRCPNKRHGKKITYYCPEYSPRICERCGADLVLVKADTK